LKRTRKTADHFYVEAGKLMRAAREKKGISQEQVGKAVGLSRTSINNIEKGRQKVLLDTFCKIARVIDEKPQALVALLPVPESVPDSVHKMLKQLPPGERQFIEEGIAQALKGEK
jgi:transcriptional regulator with XRE-family HTH domain